MKASKKEPIFVNKPWFLPSPSEIITMKNASIVEQMFVSKHWYPIPSEIIHLSRPELNDIMMYVIINMQDKGIFISLCIVISVVPSLGPLFLISVLECMIR